MSSLEHKIRVDVETSYLDEQSDPRESRYVFSYTITIRNEGQVPARLLTRHWVITDANGKVEEVRGDGDRKSTRLNSSHSQISYAVFCLKKKERATKIRAVLLVRSGRRTN